LNIWKDGNKT